MRNVLGMRMVLDTSRFVEGAKIANRALASMEYVAGRTSKRMAQFGVELESLGYIAGAGLIGAAGAAFQSRALWEKVIGPAIDGATQFDKQLRQAYYLSGMQAGSSLADGFKAEIEKLALFSSLNPAEIAKGFSEIVKTGVAESDARKMMQPLIDIVEGSFGEVDPERAGRMMGLLSLKFKKPDTVGITEWSQKLTDMSFALAEMTHLNIGDIESIMGSMSSAVALSPNTSAEEFFTLMQMLGASSMKARRIGQNLDSVTNMFLSMFSKLQDGSKKTVRGFEMLFGPAEAQNIMSQFFEFDSKSGQYVAKSLADTFGLVLDQLPNMISKHGDQGRKMWIQALDEMFGQDVGARFALLMEDYSFKTTTGEILKGSAAMKAMTEQFSKAQGNSKKAADAYRSSWEGIGKAIQGAYETFMSMIGDEMLNILSGLIMSTKDLTAQVVLFTQQRPLLRQVLAILLMVSFATGMIAAGFFSILSVATMFLIFMAPGMASLLNVFRMASGAVSRLKDSFITLKKESKIAITTAKSRMEKLNDVIANSNHLLKGVNSKFQRLAQHDLNKAILGRGDQLSKFSMIEGILSKLKIVGGILAFVFITAAVAVFTFGVAAMGLYRIFTSPLFKGKGGFLDGMIKKFQIAKNVIAGLSELMTKGFISGDTFDKLNKGGGLGILENILKIGYRLYMMFMGIAEGIDWSGFDAALKSLLDAFGSGGPMDTTFASSGQGWYEIGTGIAVVFNLMIDLAGIVLTLVAGFIRLTSKIKKFIGNNSSLIETILTITAVIAVLAIVVLSAMFVFGGLIVIVSMAMMLWQLSVIAVIASVAILLIMIASIPYVMLFMLGVALGALAVLVYKFWDKVKWALLSLFGMGMLMVVSALLPFLAPVLALIVLIGYLLGVSWGDSLDTITGKFDVLLEKIKAISRIAMRISSPFVPGLGLFENKDRIANAFASQNTGPTVPYVDAAVRSENAAVGAYNQTINLTANITVPPDTDKDAVSSELADRMAALLKSSMGANVTERGYQLEYD